jgi:transposase-like protein
LKREHRGYGDTFFIDEVFVKINGKQHYLWRAVDQDGEVVDVFLQAQRFLGTHAAVSNLFNLGRLLVRAEHYRNLRVSAFTEWSRAVA